VPGWPKAHRERGVESRRQGSHGRQPPPPLAHSPPRQIRPPARSPWRWGLARRHGGGGLHALAPEVDPAAGALAMEVGPRGEAWRRRTPRAAGRPETATARLNLAAEAARGRKTETTRRGRWWSHARETPPRRGSRWRPQHDMGGVGTGAALAWRRAVGGSTAASRLRNRRE
jgi:hypothetical protein